MKNLTKNAGLLFVALATVCLTSCTKDDLPTKDGKAVETASITVPLSIEGGNPTGKNVDRGTLPVTIDGINVTAVSTQFNWTKSTSFTLFPEGTIGNEHSFLLDNVAVGNNTLTAESVTDALPSLTTEVSVGGNPDNLMAKLRGNKPYAKYFGNGSAIVVQGGTNTVSPITLATKDGRNIAVFKLSDEFKELGVKVVIAPLSGSGITFPTMTLGGENVGLLYWNPSVTVAGDLKLFFTVTLLDKNGVILPASSQIPLGGANHTENFRLTNVAANSINTIYTIQQGGLVPQSVTETFSAIWIDNDPTNGTIGN